MHPPLPPRPAALIFNPATRAAAALLPVQPREGGRAGGRDGGGGGRGVVMVMAGNGSGAGRGNGDGEREAAWVRVRFRVRSRAAATALPAAAHMHAASLAAALVTAALGVVVEAYQVADAALLAADVERVAIKKG